MCPGDPGTSFGEHHGPHASGYAASPALWGASGSHGPRLGKTQLKATMPASWAFWSARASFCPANLQGCACPPAPASHLAPAHPTLGPQPAGGQQVLCPASGVVYPVLPGSRQRLLWRDSKPSPGLHLLSPALSSRPSALIECPLLSNDLPSGRASKLSGRAGFHVKTEPHPHSGTSSLRHTQGPGPPSSAHRIRHFRIDVQTAHISWDLEVWGVPAFPQGLGEGTPVSGGLCPQIPVFPTSKLPPLLPGPLGTLIITGGLEWSRDASVTHSSVAPGRLSL